MEEVVRIRGRAAGGILGGGLQRFLAEGRLCDLEVSSGGVSVPCHRLVLAAASPRLHGLLRAAAAPARLDLGPDSRPILKRLIRFIYGHDTKMLGKETAAFATAASSLQIGALGKALSAQLPSRLESDQSINIKPLGSSSLLLVNCGSFWDAGEYLDAEILLADQEEELRYPAHKLVLAAFSAYFESILIGTEGPAVLGLESVDPLYLRQLPLILRFMYGRPLDVPLSRVPALRDGARVFGVSSLEEGELGRKAAALTRRKAQAEAKRALEVHPTPPSAPAPVDAARIRKAWAKPASARTPGSDTRLGSPSSPVDASPFLSSALLTPASPGTSFGETALRLELRAEGRLECSERSEHCDAVNVVDTGDEELPATSFSSPLASPSPGPSKGGESCGSCGESFASARALHEHRRRAHDGTVGTMCEYCHQILPQRTDLMDHFKSVHKLQLLKCKVRGCGKEFQSRQGLINHADGHSRKSQFLCADCDYEGRSRANLSLHQRSTHGRNPDGTPLKKTYACRECASVFVYASLLRRHFAAAHLGRREFRCPDCAYAASEKGALLAHRRARHTHDRPFACDQCPDGKSFTTSSQLARHARAIHGAPGNHKCPDCGLEFGESRELRVHASREHGAAPAFPCAFCTAAFRRRDHLRVHSRKHHPDMPQ